MSPKYRKPTSGLELLWGEGNCKGSPRISVDRYDGRIVIEADNHRVSLPIRQWWALGLMANAVKELVSTG